MMRGEHFPLLRMDPSLLYNGVLPLERLQKKRETSTQREGVVVGKAAFKESRILDDGDLDENVWAHS